MEKHDKDHDNESVYNWSNNRKIMNDKEKVEKELHKSCKMGHTKGVVIFPGSPRYTYCPKCSSKSAKNAEEFYKELNKVQPKKDKVE